MSSGAICSYSFLVRITAPAQIAVLSMASLAIPIPPQAGRIMRINVKSVDAVLDGPNAYDVTIWATDSGANQDRASYEVFRAAGVAPAGGAASPRSDLNITPNNGSPYSMQTVPAVFVQDMQIEIDAGAAQIANRDFRVVLEIQGEQSPGSPTMAVTHHFSQNNF